MRVKPENREKIMNLARELLEEVNKAGLKTKGAEDGVYHMDIYVWDKKSEYTPHILLESVLNSWEVSDGLFEEEEYE